ncbi:MAG: prephenate dehydratase [Methanotrichaceae archaeon]|nr:prephenate dehydratase [Methanotrichaceae archaeon]
MKIAVLGPEGSYSEKAARRSHPGCSPLYLPGFEEIVLAVERGDAEIGVIPLENSLEGGVGPSMDLLISSRVQIVGEAIEPIRHCLLGKGEPSGIKIVLSHPQGLAQCRQYLRRKYPKAELRSTGSTSHAAKLAQEFQEMAAIAGEDAATRYNLNVIERDIQDSPNNMTRFAFVGLDGPAPTGRDKTSLVVHLERDRPGALYSMLGALKEINLTRIESRPSRLGLGDYYFFIDLEGHKDDPHVKAALDEVRRESSMVKVLGSYRRA